MSKSLLSLLLIIKVINLVISEKLFKIPFKLYSSLQFFPNQTKEYNPIKTKSMSQIVIELSIGNPPQKFNCSLNLMTFHSFFLSHKIPDIEITSFYKKSLSSTYNCSKELTNYTNEDFDKAEIFSDNIQLFSENSKKSLDGRFNFFLIDNLGENIPNEYYTSGIIGLKLGTHNNIKYPKDFNFPYQIKNKGLADNYIFYFEFNNNDKNESDNNYEGNLVIGKNVYNKNNFAKITIQNTEWSINFDRIYSGNIEVESEQQALFETEYELTVGSIVYEDIVKEVFIKEKCNMNKMKMGYESYHYYYCDEDFDENKIDNLTFIPNLKKTNINFTFTGKELFFTEGGKKYFKILFFSYPYYIWYFGRDFLKKYKLYFDIETKSIYVKYEQDFSFISLFKNIYFLITLFIVLFIICLILYFKFFSKKDKRKKRKNELEDDKLVEKENLEEL